MGEWQFERLDRSHEREGFRCGQELLDVFFASLVGQYEKRNLGRTYVAVRPGEKKVRGYYTLASSSVSFQSVPASAARKLPRHPVPVVLLARLAVDHAVQGQGLGGAMLVDALRRALSLADTLGIYAVEVDAIDMQATAFYQRFGFVPLLDREHHLFLPIATIRQAFAH